MILNPDILLVCCFGPPGVLGEGSDEAGPLVKAATSLDEGRIEILQVLEAAIGNGFVGERL